MEDNGCHDPRVFAVIPLHNDWKHTRGCLAQLGQSKCPVREIIVVDDGSSDETASEIAQEFPHVRRLVGDGNLWWTGCMNFGVRDAIARGAEFILVLNNDVLIDSEGLEELLAVALAHPKALVGSLILEASRPDVVWCAGGSIRWPWTGEFMLGTGNAKQGQYDRLMEVDWLPGMGTLVSRQLFLELGGYESRMPQYLADSDFSLRAKRLGYRVLVVPKSRLFNHVENTGGISSNTRHLSFRDAISVFTDRRSPDYLSARLLFMARHCPVHLLLPALLFRYGRLFLYLLKRAFL